MAFDYLVIVDFQVTSGAAVEEKNEQEIWEFPWVVFDVASKQVVDEKQVYVKPTNHPELATDPAVQSAGSLQQSVQDFNDYLYRSFLANNKDFCLCSFGELPLKRWLRVDAKEKGVKLAAHYSKFVDAVAEFERVYPRYSGPRTSLHRMAEHVELTVDEKTTGGLLFCRALATVLVKMVEEGATFGHAITIPDDYDPLTQPAGFEGKEEDRGRGERTRERSWERGRGRGDRDRSRSRDRDRGRERSRERSRDRDRGRGRGSPTPTARGTVVRCRGLPFSATQRDLRDFFDPCAIAPDGMVICCHPDGRATGDAFVQFETEADAGRALKRDRAQMSRRYVEVFSASESEMAEARRMSNPSSRGSGGGGGGGGDEVDPHYGGVVRMRGLPYSVTNDEIRFFFKDLAIKPDGIRMCEGRDGRPNGEAFVEFAKEGYATDALQFHRMTMGTRYVEIFKSNRFEMTQYFTQRGILPDKARGAENMYPPGENFIRMRGIPFTAREREVIEFFARNSVLPMGVSIVYNNRDQATGEAFVEFSNADDLQRGLQLNRENMGHRYVELFRSTRAEAMTALGVPGYGMGGGFAAPAADVGLTRSGGFGGGGFSGGMGGMPMGGASNSATIKIRGLPFRATLNDIADFFRGYDFIPEMIQMGIGGDGRSSGEAWITFSSAQEATRALMDRNRQSMGNRYLELFACN